jgi:hypothetical protein
MMKQIFIYAVVATAAVRAANETDTAAVIDSAVRSAPERNLTAVTATQDKKPAANLAAIKATNEDGLLVVRVSENVPVDDCVQTLLDLEVKNKFTVLYMRICYIIRPWVNFTKNAKGRCSFFVLYLRRGCGTLV